MTFRTKLLLLTSLTVAGAVALVTGAVAVSTRRAFERIDVARREALLDQFRRELDARGEELSRRVEQIASSAAIEQISLRGGGIRPGTRRKRRRNRSIFWTCCSPI